MKKILALMPFFLYTAVFAGGEVATQVLERPDKSLCHYYLDKSYTPAEKFFYHSRVAGH